MYQSEFLLLLDKWSPEGGIDGHQSQGLSFQSSESPFKFLNHILQYDHFGVYMATSPSSLVNRFVKIVAACAVEFGRQSLVSAIVSDRQNWPPANRWNKYEAIVLQINQRPPCHIASNSFVFESGFQFAFVVVVAKLDAALRRRLCCKVLEESSSDSKWFVWALLVFKINRACANSRIK